jgi:anti-sigma factor RsiW
VSESEIQSHPNAERLHGYVEESLDQAARRSVASHVAACERCRTEVAEIRSLFEALGRLPTFAPSVGFANRVMAQVRVRRPAVVAVNDWLERMAPQTTRGWAAAAAMFALPVLGATVLLAWLLTQPGVSAQGLWTLTLGLAGDGLSSGWQWVVARMTDSVLAVWGAQVAELAGSVGRGEIGLAAVLFVTLTAGSIYVLYQNLFATKAQRVEHASYLF